MGAYITIFMGCVASLMVKVYVLYITDLPFASTYGLLFLIGSVVVDFYAAGEALMNLYEQLSSETNPEGEGLARWLISYAALLVFDAACFLMSIWCAYMLFLAPWANLTLFLRRQALAPKAVSIKAPAGYCHYKICR